MHSLLRIAAKYTPRFHVAMIAFLVVLLLSAPLASAQDASTPVAPSESVPTEVSASVVPEPAPILPEPNTNEAPVIPVVPPVDPVGETELEETTESDVDADTGDPEGEPTELTVTETEAAETATATVTETATAIETETPSVSPATPEPTNTPEPSSIPASINWSQPDSISCTQLAGNAQSLALGETATWRCQTAISAEITGDAPTDLHVLWQVGANYAGDDVRFTLPAGSATSVVTPDPTPGGTNELVTYRTNWADGQTLMFDVTVTRTSCLVGEAQLALNAVVDVQTADSTVQITHGGEAPMETHLVSVAAPNPDVPAVSMQPVDFGTLRYKEGSWGKAFSESAITISNDGCATARAHNITLEVHSDTVGIVPVVTSVNGISGSAIPAILAEPNQTSVMVATIPAGFQGTSQVLVGLALEPTHDVLPGNHFMEIQIKVTAAP